MTKHFGLHLLGHGSGIFRKRRRLNFTR